MKKKLAIVCTLFLGLCASTGLVEAKNKFMTKTEATTKPTTSPLGEGTVTTPSGLKYKDLKVGNGDSPVRGQAVAVHYTGWLFPSGEKFDSSVDRKSPFQFVVGVGQVIKGWDEGVQTMKVGGKRVLLVPSELGYGDRNVGNGKIPPNSTLKFEVELLKLLPMRGR